MTFATPYYNLIIKNNTIEPGVYTTNVPVTRTHDHHMLLQASAQIEGNTFIGSASNVHMITVDGASCTFKNNKFIRGDSTVFSYIACLDGYDQFITDNFFDSPTIDGSSETLVTGLTGASIYERNINQTSYAVVSIMDDWSTSGVGDIGGGGAYSGIYLGTVNNLEISREGAPGRELGEDGSNTVLGDPVIGFDGMNYVTFRLYPDTGKEHGSLTKVFNLNSVLPSNVQLLQAKVGLAMYSDPSYMDITNNNHNFFVLRLLATNNVLTSNTTGIIDVRANIDRNSSLNGSSAIYEDKAEWTARTYSLNISNSSGSGGGGGLAENFNYASSSTVTAAQMATGVHYLTVSSTGAGSDKFRTGASTNRRIALCFELYAKTIDEGTEAIDYTISPILIKYRW